MPTVGILYRGSYIDDALGAILGTRTGRRGKGQSRAGCCVFLSCEDRMAHWGTFRQSQVGQRSRRDRLDRDWGLIASRVAGVESRRCFIDGFLVRMSRKSKVGDGFSAGVSA